MPSFSLLWCWCVPQLGLTPLSSLCLRYHQGREKEEADFLEYLVVDEGANVNNLDKVLDPQR
jgi:hypothetical protein